MRYTYYFAALTLITLPNIANADLSACDNISDPDGFVKCVKIEEDDQLAACNRIQDTTKAVACTHRATVRITKYLQARVDAMNKSAITWKYQPFEDGQSARITSYETRPKSRYNDPIKIGIVIIQSTDDNRAIIALLGDSDALNCDTDCELTAQFDSRPPAAVKVWRDGQSLRVLDNVALVNELANTKLTRLTIDVEQHGPLTFAIRTEGFKPR